MKTRTGQSTSIKKRWNLFSLNGDTAEGEPIERHLKALGIDPTVVTDIVLSLHRDGTFSLHVKSRHPATMSDYEWRKFKRSIGEDPYEDFREYVEQERALPRKVATIPLSADLAQKLILAACLFNCPDWLDATGGLTVPR